ncbi:hypothetical protein THOG05_800001 [Vibrio rotiferianus]|nr:hypothetical protein THOG05_800001 [Vibrio rotiferianus]
MLVQQIHQLTFNYDVETKITHNALLRGEQRNTKAAAYNLNH